MDRAVLRRIDLYRHKTPSDRMAEQAADVGPDASLRH